MCMSKVPCGPWLPDIPRFCWDCSSGVSCASVVEQFCGLCPKCVWLLINNYKFYILKYRHECNNLLWIVIYCCLFAGLKAGDEIVEINKKAAEDLNSVMLRDVLVQPSLCLIVRTYPESEQKLTQLPPRRTDGSFDLTDSPLRSVNNSQGTPPQ